MPQVPTYGDQRVRTQPLQPVFQNAPDVSSGARALAQGLGQVADVADRIDLRDAQAKAFDAEAKITSEWLKWDGQARQKYRGQNVDQYGPAAEEWWKTAAETYGKDLDPRAKALASRSLSSKQLQAINSVGAFVNAEKERHADETYTADVATTIQFGVTSGDVASTAQQIREKAAVVGARKGWTTEQVQAEVGKNLSAMHLAHITKLADTNAEAAQAYYDANKAEVGFAQQARVEQVLKGEMDNQFATRKAAEWAGKPLAEQLAEAAKIEDPQRREKTLTQIKNNQALVKAAEQERENAAADQAWQLFAQGKRIPETVLASMAGRERVQLQEAQRTRAERLAAGPTQRAVKTDWATYEEVREKIARGEPVRVAAYSEKIGGSEIEKLIDLKTRRDNPTKAPEVATTEQQIGTYIDSLELGGAKKAEERGKFKAAAQDLFNEHLKRTGKEPTFDERQALLDKLTVEVVTKPGRIWDTKGPAYTLPRDQLRQQMAPQTSGPVRVKTIEEARALPPNTRFIDPNGIQRIR
jgi:PIN domain nuclease of toxin-antitoxin system